MTTKIEYKITETSITEDNDVFVAFKCYVDDTDLFESAITVVPDTPLDTINKLIEDRVYNMATSIMSRNTEETKRKEEQKNKKTSAVSLKSLIDKEKGKQKLIDKPIKMEHNNERRLH